MNRRRDFQPIFPIPVKNQKPRSRPKWKYLPQLLNDPKARRVLRNIGVYDPTPTVADDEEAVEYAERNRWNHEEVHRGGRFQVIGQKGEPALGWFRISRGSFHPTRNRSIRNIKTEHEKLTVDPRCTPRRIFGNHSKDQLANFIGDPSSSDLITNSGDQFPTQMEPHSMSTGNSLGRNDDESSFPSRPESTSGDPEEPVDD